MAKEFKEKGEPTARDIQEAEVFLKKSIKLANYSPALLVSKDESLDPMTQYLREIYKVPLLTPAEEHDLTVIKDLKPLPEDPIEVANELRIVNEEAVNDIWKANLRLVVSIAKHYANNGVALMDLVQEGNIGLKRGINKFDPGKGYRLTTYTSWWIRQAVTRHIADNARTIRIPVYMVSRINKMRKTQTIMEQELGRRPTNAELGERMNLKPDEIERMMIVDKKPLSTDADYSEDSDGTLTLGDIIEDKNVDIPEEVIRRIHNEEIRAVFEAGWKNLKEKEKRVLTLRFGLEDGRSRTLEETGKECGFTRERARQHEASALQKLRQPEIMERAKGLL